jgi:thioredoxin reductase (NADPH)
VSGEDQSKVVYRMLEPKQYRGSKALVFGGGDSALEGVLSPADEPGTKVILSYRGDAFSRVKPKSRERIRTAEKSGAIKVMLQSRIKKIESETVNRIDKDGKHFDMPNEVIVVRAGGVLPTGFLKEIGFKVETRHGT